MNLEDDHFCFACGSLNNSGLKLSFKLDKKNKTISTGKKLTFTAKITSEKAKLLIIEGGCLDENNQKIASSTSKCLKINKRAYA